MLTVLEKLQGVVEESSWQIEGEKIEKAVNRKGIHLKLVPPGLFLPFNTFL